MNKERHNPAPPHEWEHWIVNGEKLWKLSLAREKQMLARVLSLLNNKELSIERKTQAIEKNYSLIHTDYQYISVSGIIRSPKEDREDLILRLLAGGHKGLKHVVFYNSVSFEIKYSIHPLDAKDYDRLMQGKLDIYVRTYSI